MTVNNLITNKHYNKNHSIIQKKEKEREKKKHTQNTYNTDKECLKPKSIFPSVCNKYLDSHLKVLQKKFMTGT